jgi:hypothetical protein
MKYFTSDLYSRLQEMDKPSKLHVALQEWDQAARNYDQQLQKILPDFPRTLRRLVSDYPLHDGDVLSVGDGGDTFVILVQLENAPNDLVEMVYFLKSKPEIDKFALPGQFCSPSPQWLHDEISIEPHYRPNEAKTFVHDIQLSNGWEVKLRFSDLELRRYDALLPQFVETPAN